MNALQFKGGVIPFTPDRKPRFKPIMHHKRRGLGHHAHLEQNGKHIGVREFLSSVASIDISGDSLDHRTAWAGAGDGVLFIDADGNVALSESGMRGIQ
jgi:hypothetical protein